MPVPHIHLRYALLALLQAATITRAQTPSPPSPEQLLYNTLHTLQAAPHLSVDVHRESRTFATAPIANPDHQSLVNMIYSTSQSIALERPGRFRLTQTWTAPKGPYLTFDILDNSTLLIGSQRDPTRPWTGSTGHFPDTTLDSLFRSNQTGIPASAHEISLLLDSQSYERFFQYVTHLESLGAAADNAIPVWRIRFQDLDDPSATWELWITQEDPPRITRLLTSRSSNMSISNNEKNDSFSEYPLTAHVECTFSNWNLDTPLPADAFTPPAGHFKRATYDKTAFPLGATLPFPALSDTTGTPINLNHPTAPLLIEFFTIKSEWNEPALETLVHSVAPQALRFYIVDSYDSADQLRDYFTKGHRPQPPILLDPDQTYEKAVGNHAWPTVLLLSPDGKLLAHEYPDALGLARLKTALTTATTPPTK